MPDLSRPHRPRHRRQPRRRRRHRRRPGRGRRHRLRHRALVARAARATEGLPGTVEDAAAEVIARGGTGIGVRLRPDRPRRGRRRSSLASASTSGRLRRCSSTTPGEVRAAYRRRVVRRAVLGAAAAERWDAMSSAPACGRRCSRAPAPAPLLCRGSGARSHTHRARGPATPTSASVALRRGEGLHRAASPSRWPTDLRARARRRAVAIAPGSPTTSGSTAAATRTGWPASRSRWRRGSLRWPRSTTC